MTTTTSVSKTAADPPGTTAATAPKKKEPRVSSTGIPLKRLITIFIGLLLGILMAALDQTVVATALPHIGKDFESVQGISWLIVAYLLAQTIVMPIYGKIGDFIGRKLAFMIAIVIFLVGSILAGIAPTMGVLILFRAVQGVGAGGLMIGAQTIIAEIVSARERGRYMSIMGPMIGVATVLGPLLGGWLTDAVSWRWIFYINIPIGIAALVITGMMLKLPKTRREVSIDFGGIATLAVAAASLVLMLNWGGRKYDWNSGVIIGLGIIAVIMIPLFIWAESRAKQPIMPLRLFRDEIFHINTPLALFLGVAMFGAVSFLPTYLQLSLGASAAMSGVLMLPLMGGLMAAAVTTGQLMTITGRYKMFPIGGTLIAAVGMFLLSTMDGDTTRSTTSLFMIVLGVGIGFIMPTLILTVQNSVGPRDMSVATAGVNFFRQIGASIGTAIIGSMFVSRLVPHLTANLQKVPSDVMTPEVAGKLQAAGRGMTVDTLNTFPEPVQSAYIHAYADSLMPLFAYLVPFLLAGFVLVIFMKEKPLSSTLRRGRGDSSHDPIEDAKWTAARRGISVEEALAQAGYQPDGTSLREHVVASSESDDEAGTNEAGSNGTGNANGGSHTNGDAAPAAAPTDGAAPVSEVTQGPADSNSGGPN